MEYILSSVFGQTAARYGLRAGLVVLVLFAVVAVVAYYAKARIDASRLDAQGRAAERQALLGELATSRSQIHSFLTNHLAHLAKESEAAKQDREKHYEIMGKMTVAQQAMTDAIEELVTETKAHRLEEGTWSAGVSGKLEVLHRAIIKGGAD